MQANEIILAIDQANDGNPTNKTFRRYDAQPNRTVYIGPNHEPTNRDMITLFRTPAKRAGNFRGVNKTAVKLTTDLNVPGVDMTTYIVAPFILECSFSIPAGTSAENIKLMRQTLISILDNDLIMDGLNIQLDI